MTMMMMAFMPKVESRIIYFIHIGLRLNCGISITNCHLFNFMQMQKVPKCLMIGRQLSTNY